MASFICFLFIVLSLALSQSIFSDELWAMVATTTENEYRMQSICLLLSLCFYLLPTLIHIISFRSMRARVSTRAFYINVLNLNKSNGKIDPYIVASFDKYINVSELNDNICELSRHGCHGNDFNQSSAFRNPHHISDVKVAGKSVLSGSA